MLQNNQNLSPIPISILIATKNEQDNLPQCLNALNAFNDIIIIDSNSTDNTLSIAQTYGATIHNFHWNGTYPKKRQWILDNIKTQYDWVFFLDADEIMTEKMEQELRRLFQNPPPHTGYFIKANYRWNKKELKHGLQNKKLCLLKRQEWEFPQINDLTAPGMGEIEGHYQPKLKNAAAKTIGTLKNHILHDAYKDKNKWLKRHENYAAWEQYMNTNKLWPKEDNHLRNIIKALFRATALQPAIAFTHSYILKAGFLDGKAGYDFAKSRYYYYQAIRKISNA